MKIPRRFLTALCLAAQLVPAVAGPRPNILFIFSDDQRFDAIGKANPRIQTPNLDALAGKGVYFPNAQVTTAICSPSRAACLTGVYGSRNGVSTLGTALKFPQSTFTHALASAGYRTAQMGKWHLATSPAEAGFQSFAAISGNGSWFQRSIDTNVPGLPDHLGGKFYETFVADAVIDWISKHETDHPEQPFIMWWCNQVPHLDNQYQYPAVTTPGPNGTADGNFRDHYRAADMVVPPNWSDSLATKPPYLATSRFVTQSASHHYGGPGGYTNPSPGVRNPTLGQDNVQQHLLEYYAAISALDTEIGRVIARLDDPNGDGDTRDSIAANTWIVFMGDNGWQTGSHKFTSKVLAYEEAARVPLIVKIPGVVPRVENKIALNIDLTAMFYSAAGLPIPPFVQGRDLAALVRDSSAPWRDSYYYEAVTAEPSLYAQPLDAIRTDRYKLIRTYSTTASAKANKGITYEELYDLQKDPYEMENLATLPAHAALKTDLTRKLEAEKTAVAATPDPQP